MNPTVLLTCVKTPMEYGNTLFKLVQHASFSLGELVRINSHNFVVYAIYHRLWVRAPEPSIISNLQSLLPEVTPIVWLSHTQSGLTKRAKEDATRTSLHDHLLAKHAGAWELVKNQSLFVAHSADWFLEPFSDELCKGKVYSNVASRW